MVAISKETGHIDEFMNMGFSRPQICKIYFIIIGLKIFIYFFKIIVSKIHF